MKLPTSARNSLKRLISIAAVIAILAVQSPAHASYIAIDFTRLCGWAELIVMGEIVEMTDESFTLRVDATLKGDARSKTVEIRKFKDWACAHRWCSHEGGTHSSKPYAIGQREIAFLSRSEKGESLWGVIGGGDEGEWEIQGDRAAVQGRALEGFASFSSSEHRAQWVPLEDALDVIREFGACFAMTPASAKSWSADVRTTCPAARLEELSSRSLLHRLLLDPSLDPELDRAQPRATPMPDR